ncbi:hypothetical protein ACN47E_008778 [Coniothyrium glycines]
MVATRQHPRGDFPITEPSPTKRPSTRSRTSTPAPGSTSPDLTTSPTFSTSPTANPSELARRAIAKVKSDTMHVISPPAPEEIGEDGWCHTVSNLTVLWIAVSFPLVLWDILYILLRPHTMAGGALQWPLWKPYEVYAAIDHLYGQPGWDDKVGFGGAQGVLNAVETVMYGLYAMIVYNHGVPTVGGAGVQIGSGVSGWFAGGRKVRGKAGNRALLIGFAAAVMTLSKTVLYYFNEYFSDFANVRHNDWLTLFLFYGVMNSLWVIFPAYMTITFGTDLLQALDVAAESGSKRKY